MKVIVLLTVFSTLLFGVSAGVAEHSPRRQSAHHNRLSRSTLSRLARRQSNKHCAAIKSASAGATSTSSAAKTASTQKTSTTSSAGLINVQSNQCGSSGATYDVTATTGPNGSIQWLNCGIDGGGWNPPYIQISDLMTMDLDDALNDPNSPFHACGSDSISKFKQYAGQNGLPAIVIASIAMQESSCNPATVGGAGEQGLMQLTHDKCVNAPGGNCQDLDYNISTGAKFFADSLAGHNGNVLLTIGGYNGWPAGLTYAGATAAQYTSCCRCQNNLDYLFQFLNGWLRNINAYTNNPKLGLYFNLTPCYQQ